MFKERFLCSRKQNQSHSHLLWWTDRPPVSSLKSFRLSRFTPPKTIGQPFCELNLYLYSGKLYQFFTCSFFFFFFADSVKKKSYIFTISHNIRMADDRWIKCDCHIGRRSLALVNLYRKKKRQTALEHFLGEVNPREGWNQSCTWVVAWLVLSLMSQLASEHRWRFICCLLALDSLSSSAPILVPPRRPSYPLFPRLHLWPPKANRNTEGPFQLVTETLGAAAVNHRHSVLHPRGRASPPY